MMIVFPTNNILKTSLWAGIIYGSAESLFTFYEEHSRLTNFGVVKKSSQKKKVVNTLGI